MKKTKFLQIMILCLTLSSCESCEEKEWDTLPPKTQRGANTLGCYVNGELLVGQVKGFIFPPAGFPPLVATFERKTNRLTIDCWSNDNQQIWLETYNPIENESEALALGFFAPGGIRDCDNFGCDNCGSILITKFDTIKRIVSGTFEFSGRCFELTYDESGAGMLMFTGDSIVHVTDGRFDMRLYLED